MQDPDANGGYHECTVALRSSFLVGENGVSILSEPSIKDAKEKRKRLRQIGASTSDDFISLSVSKWNEGPEGAGPHPESRLVREEDELGDGDDGMSLYAIHHNAYTHEVGTEFAEYTSAQERIALGRKTKKAEASKMKEAMMELIVDALVPTGALYRDD
jgi:GC-rich sequence DNA-binding factor